MLLELQIHKTLICLHAIAQTHTSRFQIYSHKELENSLKAVYKSSPAKALSPLIVMLLCSEVSLDGEGSMLSAISTFSSGGSEGCWESSEEGCELRCCRVEFLLVNAVLTLSLIVPILSLSAGSGVGGPLIMTSAMPSGV